ncbi:hypothetical protein QOT17_016705 [Balamuthia mandrillaris]
MGGCFDKPAIEEEKHEERQRFLPGSDRGRGDTESALTLPVLISAKGEEEGGIGFGSVTDRRTREDDFFRNIVSKTARNFIDISSYGTTPLPNEERAELAHFYSKKAKEAQTTANLSLLSLPSPLSNTHNETSIKQLLSSPSLPAASASEQLSSLSSVSSFPHQVNDLTTAFNSMTVTDCGKIVVHFEDLSFSG